MIVGGKNRPGPGRPPSTGPARARRRQGQRGQLVEVHPVLDRAKDAGLVHAVADRDAAGKGDQRLANRIVDVVMDVKPLQRGAGLAIVDERAPEQALGNAAGSASGSTMPASLPPVPVSAA